MEIQVDKLTLGQTIKALKDTSEGLTELEIEFPNRATVRKVVLMKQLVDHLDTPELIFEGSIDTNYRN